VSEPGNTATRLAVVLPVTISELTTFAADRFSPTQFAPDHVISDAQVNALLDAAGRAPSAGNSQPWSFIVGRRGDAIHTRLARHLAPSSRRWAPDASLLIANLSQQRVADSDLQYSEFARYDLGQAVAHLTVQAHLLALSVHQFRAFDRDGLAAEFAVPAHWEVTSLAAVGSPIGDRHSPAVAGTSRERKSRDSITWARVRASESP
jgi:nitroreductase